MTVKIVLFARAKELVGQEKLSMEFPATATVLDLKKELTDQYPKLSDFLKHCAIAVDQNYANDDQILTEGCEVGLIPPVSGG